MKYKLFPIVEEGSFPIFSKVRPSEEIEAAVCDGGGPVRDCDLCGRVHFDVNGEHMNEGELEKLLKKQEANPEKYLGHDGGIHFGYIDGGAFVCDCPCNGLTLYEDFLWEVRFIAANFLKAKAEANLSQAQVDMEAASAVEGSV